MICDANRAYAQARSDAVVAAGLARDYAPQIMLDLDFIAEHWPDLLESRMPGSSRPWRQALLDPDERARAAARDREEREVRDPDAPGFTSAPEHVDVLDVIVTTWFTIDELVALISPDWRRTNTGGALTRAEAEHAPTPVTDIDRMLDFIRDWLPRIELTDPQTTRVGRISRRLTTQTTEITRVLGLIRAGQLLNGAVCPWCRGVTPKQPAGGANTMRVEEIPGSSNLGTAAAPAVFCWNSLCDPPDDAGGFRYRGRPAWPYHDWGWLAARLIIAEPAQTPPAPAPARPAGFSSAPVLPIERFATSGISRTAPAGTPRRCARRTHPAGTWAAAWAARQLHRWPLRPTATPFHPHRRGPRCGPGGCRAHATHQPRRPRRRDRRAVPLRHRQRAGQLRLDRGLTARLTQLPTRTGYVPTTRTGAAAMTETETPEPLPSDWRRSKVVIDGTGFSLRIGTERGYDIVFERAEDDLRTALGDVYGRFLLTVVPWRGDDEHVYEEGYIEVWSPNLFGVTPEAVVQTIAGPLREQMKEYARDLETLHGAGKNWLYELRKQVHIA